MSELEQPKEQPIDEMYKDRVKTGRRYPEHTHMMMMQGDQCMEDYLYIRALTPQEQWDLHDRICALKNKKKPEKTGVKKWIRTKRRRVPA